MSNNKQILINALEALKVREFEHATNILIKGIALIEKSEQLHAQRAANSLERDSIIFERVQGLRNQMKILWGSSEKYLEDLDARETDPIKYELAWLSNSFRTHLDNVVRGFVAQDGEEINHEPR
jgi:hypothetical protein